MESREEAHIYQKELKRSNIDHKELTHYLHEGKENFERYKTQADLFVNDSIIKFNYNTYDMTREEAIEKYIQKTVRAKELKEQFDGGSVNYTNYDVMGPPLNGLAVTSLHHGMFESVLRILGSDEQIKEYLPKVISYEILGCYAQTEMGHGSDVQNLKTEAVFDKENDWFVVNTPEIKDCKFWPGELGKQANYCVFHAKLIIDGESYGTNAFITRIRDDDAHRPLKGLEIGEIGPKYGYMTKDNGYMIFKDFKIPRSALLSRYIKISKDGILNIQGDPKVAYSTMLYVRITLVNFTWKVAISYCLIAVRYLLFRKQFQSIPNSKKERRLMDYQATQHVLIPYLAKFYGAVASSKQWVLMFK